MKKILSLVVALVLMVSVALAAGEWHYCDLCGREHSGVRCPEACQNDCSENANGYQHKWYDCSERVVSACWYCGDDSGEHYENCCPNWQNSQDSVVWNDIKGSFRSMKYASEDGIRTPEYCSYCQHYGYHSTDECLSNPNRVVPTAAPTVEVMNTPGMTALPTLPPTEAPVVTAEPTAVPTAIPTAVPTVAPTTEPCYHENYSIAKTVASQEIQTPDYCQVMFYWEQAVCDDCGYRGERHQTVDKVEHTMNNGVCTTCKYGAKTENQNTNTNANNNNVNTNNTACSHDISTEYAVSNYYYVANGNICYHMYDTETRCDRCHAVLKNGVHVEERDHVVRNGVCIRCGIVIEVAPMATVVPTTQPEANAITTVQPTFPTTVQQNQSQEQTVIVEDNGTDWWKVALVIIGFVIIMLLICRVYREYDERKHRSAGSRRRYDASRRRREGFPEGTFDEGTTSEARRPVGRHAARPEAHPSDYEVVEAHFVDDEEEGSNE